MGKFIILGALVAIAEGQQASTGLDPSGSLDFFWGADAQGGAPYVFPDPTNPNRLTGFEVELASLLAARMGRSPKVVLAPWDQLLQLLQRGDFDFAINGIEVADEKRRVVALSRPYMRVPETLTVRRGDPRAPRSLLALQGRKVGTLPGSTAERILDGVGAAVRTYEGGQGDLYEDLKLRRLDAVLLDEPVARYFGALERDLELVPGDFGVVEYAVAVRLTEPARLAQVNDSLTALIRDGQLRELYERWGVWNLETAALFGDPDPAARHEATALAQWQAAVGNLPSFSQRVLTRYPQALPLLLQGALVTLETSLTAMALAVAFGLCLTIGRRLGPAPIRVSATLVIELLRGTPLLIQLTMVYFGLPEIGLKLDPFAAGVVALGLNYGAAEAENYRAGLESVPKGQLEAAAVLGLSRWQTLKDVLAPQAMRVAIPPMTNDFIALLKDSSLVSVVTLTELTKTYGNLANAMRDHLGLGLVVALLYLALGLPFAWWARRAEKHLGRHLRREVT